MLYPFCHPVREIVHPLQLVDYSFVHEDRPWYNYKLYHSLFASTGDSPLAIYIGETSSARAS